MWTLLAAVAVQAAPVQPERAPPAVQRGRPVTVVVRGPGYEIAGEGRALMNADLNRYARASLNGRIVEGVAVAPGRIQVTAPR